MAGRRETAHPHERCHRLGHAWDEYNPAPGEWEARSYAATRYVEYSRCERCGATRRFQLDATGQVVARQYHYPEGYGWTDASGGRPTRAEMRLMRIKRDGKMRRIA